MFTVHIDLTPAEVTGLQSLFNQNQLTLVTLPDDGNINNAEVNEAVIFTAINLLSDFIESFPFINQEDPLDPHILFYGQNKQTCMLSLNQLYNHYFGVVIHNERAATSNTEISVEGFDDLEEVNSYEIDISGAGKAQIYACFLALLESVGLNENDIIFEDYISDIVRGLIEFLMEFGPYVDLMEAKIYQAVLICETTPLHKTDIEIIHTKIATLEGADYKTTLIALNEFAAETFNDGELTVLEVDKIPFNFKQALSPEFSFQSLTQTTAKPTLQ